MALLNSRVFPSFSQELDQGGGKGELRNLDADGSSSSQIVMARVKSTAYGGSGTQEDPYSFPIPPCLSAKAETNVSCTEGFVRLSGSRGGVCPPVAVPCQYHLANRLAQHPEPAGLLAAAEGTSHRRSPVHKHSPSLFLLLSPLLYTRLPSRTFPSNSPFLPETPSSSHRIIKSRTHTNLL